MQKVCVALSLLLAAQSAFAGNYNPFLGKVTKEKSAKNPVSAKTAPAPSSTQLPLSSLPSVPPVYRPPVEDRTGSPSNSDPAREPKANFSIAGRIGDQIVLTDRAGGKLMVQDGSTRGGCFIRFPDILCDKAEIAQAKKELAAEARTRVEQDEAISSQKEKIKELSAALAAAQESLRISQKEMAEARNAAASAKAEVTNLKTGTGDDRAQIDRLKKLLAEANAANAVLTSANSSMFKKLVKADGDRESITALEGRLAKALERGEKAEQELLALRIATTTPPSWVKGAAKEYNDPVLGAVKVSRAGDQVFFCVGHEGENSADTLFGKSVLRKERKGSFTYYALNSHNVRVKE